MLLFPCRYLYDVIVSTKQDEDKFNFIFLLGPGIYGWASNSSALYFPGYIHAHDIAFLINDRIIYVSLEYRTCY